MSAPVITTQNWLPEAYDLVIDVRAPSEFAEDHIVGAVNMPVLSDAERVEVGTLYKQTSPFAARKRGAALVSRNIALHLEERLRDYPSDFSPLIHCWRGGQRSRAFAHILSEVGWRCHLLQGGYKAYRRDILDRLAADFSGLSLVIIAGRTGSAKTDILGQIAKMGGQILDLEGLACHRGSLLGRWPDTPQPTQRYFESALIKKVREFDKAKPVYVESESSRIGNVQLPTALWRLMTTSPMVIIETPAQARAEYLLSGYDHLLGQNSDMLKLIGGMRHRHGAAITDNWRDLLDAENWLELAKALLIEHYDPAYDGSVGRHQREVLARLSQKDCQPETIAQTAQAILAQAPARPQD
ncbi:MAG: tRNA 2-selenouridine(34) synthase MnmH [Candidatus Puniceispirillaceae bacterium]